MRFGVGEAILEKTYWLSPMSPPTPTLIEKNWRKLTRFCPISPLVPTLMGEEKIWRNVIGFPQYITTPPSSYIDIGENLLVFSNISPYPHPHMAILEKSY
jgi:hypothetical protein